MFRLSSAVFNLLRAVVTEVLSVLTFVSRFSTLTTLPGSMSFHEGMAERRGSNTFWTFSTFALAVSRLPASVCFCLTLPLYALAEEVRVVANSFGDSFQSICQSPAINSDAFCMAFSISPFFDATSASAVMILLLHSVIAFSASGTFAAKVPTFLRFASSALRKFLASVSCVSPSFIWAFRSTTVFDVDSSRVERADRVVDSNFSIPQALHASNAFNSALATDLSSSNNLVLRSYDFDSVLISASSFTFVSTNFLCSFSASS